MLGSLHEVRPGRSLWLETLYGNPSGQLAPSNLVGLLVHGAMCVNAECVTALHPSLAQTPTCAAYAGVTTLR